MNGPDGCIVRSECPPRTKLSEAYSYYYIQTPTVGSAEAIIMVVHIIYI